MTTQLRGPQIGAILENHELRVRDLEASLEKTAASVNDVIAKFNKLLESNILERVNELIDSNNTLEERADSTENELKNLRVDMKKAVAAAADNGADEVIEELTTQVSDLHRELSKVTSDLSKTRTLGRSSNSLVRALKTRVEALENPTEDTVDAGAGGEKDGSDSDSD